MTTTKTRAELALAACEGMTDAELQERGAGSFKKMIERKRSYATQFRMAAAGLKVLAEKTKGVSTTAEKQLAKANQTIAMIEALDAPVASTADATSILANIAAKKD